MADALCGPSNPLQNLQKHTQVDRTLQQDRLVGNRQSPAQVSCALATDTSRSPTLTLLIQGFRTIDPRAGSLDADFHAFENSTPNPFQFQQPDLFHPQNQSSPAPGGWAADFQRLSISQSPLPAGQFRTEAPLIRSAPLGGWQNEFMRQRSAASTPVAQGKQAMRDGPQMNTFQPQMMNYGEQPFQYQLSGYPQEQQFQQQPMSTMNMDQHNEISNVDFDAAFADALAHAQEMDQHRASQLESQAQPDQIDLQQTVQPENIKIGSDALPYVERQDRTLEQDTRDADELARTAGELLNSVSHDTSEKFQNSQFLQLMRRIRDREVEVQNNDLQHTGTTSKSAVDAQRYDPTLQQHQQQDQPRTTTDTNHFAFPDMDAVYAPTNSDDVWSDTLAQTETQARHSPYTSYGFDDDQFPPQTQIEALHPGGKYYPDQSPRLQRAGLAPAEGEVEMSGAVPPVSGGSNTVEDGATLEKRISASDFDYVDESAGLARRFVRYVEEPQSF